MKHPSEMTDRELDEAVAREVMGGIDKGHHQYDHADNRYPVFVTSSGSLRLLDWRPSISISAAWEIIEHWGVLPWELDNCWREVDGQRINGVTCTLTTHTDTIVVTAPTAPRAISEAAVLAKRGMQPGIGSGV